MTTRVVIPGVLRDLAGGAHELVVDLPGPAPLGDVLDQIHAAENDKGLRLNFFPIVVGERPNLELAKRVSSKREAAVLKGLNYQSMFVWVTQAIERHAKSRLGEVVKLPATDGWRES